MILFIVTLYEMGNSKWEENGQILKFDEAFQIIILVLTFNVA